MDIAKSQSYVAVTVHFQKDGVLVAMILDLVEVAESHSGTHLAAVFVKILEDFTITDKVSTQLYRLCRGMLTWPRSSASHVTTPLTMTRWWKVLKTC
jgi:hypothetical protein